MNPKDFPDVKIKDILEIYQPEEKFSRLLLQVTSLKEDFQQRGKLYYPLRRNSWCFRPNLIVFCFCTTDTISVDQVVATTFQLRTYLDTIINVVSPEVINFVVLHNIYYLYHRLVTECFFLSTERCPRFIRANI